LRHAVGQIEGEALSLRVEGARMGAAASRHRLGRAPRR